MYEASLWNRARREGRDFYGESSRNPYVKGTYRVKHDFGDTVVGWGGGGDLESIKDPVPITKSEHKNTWFTCVNFHLANGKNTSVWRNN